MWRQHSIVLGVAILVIGASFALLFPKHASALNTGFQDISFEGKIVTSAGINIPDGTYNIEFNIYTGCTNEPTNSTGCSSVWTEDWLVHNTQGVTFTSGTFEANLGSITALPVADFISSDSPLYLSIQIGNDTNDGAVNCVGTTNFQTNCGGDGVMNPYIALSASPYSLNSGEVGGLTTSQLGVLSAANVFQPTTSATGLDVEQNSSGTFSADIFDVQGTGGSSDDFIQVTNTAANAGAVNITSRGATNAITLQSGSGTVSLGSSTILSATGALEVESGGAGALTLGSASNTIALASGTTGISSAAALTVSSGGTSLLQLTTPGSTSAQTGGITIESGSATTGANLSAGTVYIDTGTQTGAGTGAINIGTSNADTITIGDTSTTAGTVTNIEGGNNTTAAIALLAGNGAASGGGAGGAIKVNAGTGGINGTTGQTGGSITIQAGAGGSSTAGGTGGATSLQGGAPGTGTGSPTYGTVSIQTLGNGGVAIGSTADTGTLYFGQSTAGGETISIGNGDLGSGAENINIGAPTTTSGTVAAKFGALQSTSTTLIQGGSGAGAITLDATGSSTTGVVIKNATLSTAAFAVQNTSGDAILSVDTTDALVNIGLNNSTQGTLVFNNSGTANTVGIKEGATATSYTWTLPTADSAGCLESNGSGTLSISLCGDTSTQTFISSGNYTVPTNALMAIIEGWGGGGGGGGGVGGTTAAVRSGGGGGGGGTYDTTTLASSTLGSSGTTIPVTIGAAGGGGASGANGVAGGASCFSTTTGCAGNMYLEAFGGGFGAGAGTAGNGGGGGGGSQGVGSNAATATGGAGGSPLGAAVGAQNSGSGGAGGATAAAAGANGGSSNWGGGGGAASTTAGAGASGAGGGSNQGAGGGGAGGTCAITTCTLRAGGAGGHVPGLSGGGGTAGTTAGQAGGTGSAGQGSGGDGGGGGANNAAGTGGTGGPGGARGGGGGGGGAGETTTGGAGGTGGTGYLRVTTLQGSGADLAEIYCTNDSSIESGDVVAIDPALQAGVKKTAGAYDPNTIGIISTDPGLTTGTIEDQCVKPVLVALSGRVPTAVSLENGPIEPGDYLTASSTPGVAMRATKSGQIIGQALTSYTDPSQAPFVVTFVEKGQFNGASLSSILPTPSDSSQSIEQQALTYFLANKAQVVQQTNLSEIMTDRLSADLEIITPTVISDTVSTNTITPSTTGNITIALGANNQLLFTDEDNKTSFSIDGTGNATFGLNLSVLGEMQASGGLTVDGSSQFNGPATFSDMAQFLGNTTFAGNINAAGRITFNSDTGGFAVIKQGASQVDVTFKNAYARTPIISAILSAQQVQLPDGTNENIQTEEQQLFNEGYTYLISNVTTTGFTIVLNKNATQDIEFNWLSIAVNNANTTTATPNTDGTGETSTSAPTPEAGDTTPSTFTSNPSSANTPGLATGQ